MNVFLVLVIVIGAFAGFIVIMSRLETKGAGKKKSVVRFYAQGKDLGFSFKEIELLRRLAVKSNIEDPSVLFWSQIQLDNCIRSLIQTVRLAGTDQQPDIQEFLSKLYDYRKKLELDRPKKKNGLMSTRQIGESQSLRILVQGAGVFQSQLVKNTSQYITITRPSGSNASPNFSWTGQRVSVYFWRSEDAGYVFDSDVIDEVYSKGQPAIKITHSDSLFRTQKRKSIRMKTYKSAFLYLHGPGSSDDVEAVPGYKCILNDISDTGCAVTVGGKASAGLRVKIQFVLKTAPRILCGTIRSVDYNEEAKRSVLHIEADLIPQETRNEILGEVFGMREDEDALPSRITEENFEDKSLIGDSVVAAAEVELQDIQDNNLEYSN